MTVKTLFPGLVASQCAICGRALSDPTSVARGIGPICYGRLGKENQMNFFEHMYDELYLDVPVENNIIMKRDETGAWTNVPSLVKHHSPTGFEWGYAGSGPADLALNIIELALRKTGWEGEVTTDVWDGSEIFVRSLALHQKFKFDIIAKVGEEGGMISWDGVLYFLKRMDEQVNKVLHGRKSS